MVSYLKTQCFKLIVALGALVLMIVNMVQNEKLLVVAWAVTFVYCLLESYSSYNAERIKLLEAKAKKYDALVEKVDALYERLTLLENHAITDIDKVSDNHYECRRRLGPDKEIPYPEEKDD